jgi:hypothetical protein
MQALTLWGFVWRSLFALLLVFASFNPSGYSYFHWAKSIFPSVNPYIALAGILLIAGWAIYLRATLRSLGVFGMTLAALLVGCLIWIFVDLGWLDWTAPTHMMWVALVVMSWVLALGMSWSHLRRRLSGQVDTDDVGDQS